MLQLRKGKRLGRKTLTLPLLECRYEIDADGNPRGRAWTDGMRSSQTRRCLGMAHHHRTPDAAIKARTCRRPSVSPGITTERSHDGTSKKGSPTGLLGQLYGPGKMTNEWPPRDKHLWFLTLSVKFITELPTPAAAGTRTSLGGCRGCLPG